MSYKIGDRVQIKWSYALHNFTIIGYDKSYNFYITEKEYPNIRTKFTCNVGDSVEYNIDRKYIKRVLLIFTSSVIIGYAPKEFCEWCSK